LLSTVVCLRQLPAPASTEISTLSLHDALPISYVGGSQEPIWEPIPGQRFLAPLLAGALFVEISIAVLGTALTTLGEQGPTVRLRSEERRVGKEWRWGGSV